MQNSWFTIICGGFNDSDAWNAIKCNIKSTNGQTFPITIQYLNDDTEGLFFKIYDESMNNLVSCFANDFELQKKINKSNGSFIKDIRKGICDDLKKEGILYNKIKEAIVKNISNPNNMKSTIQDILGKYLKNKLFALLCQEPTQDKMEPKITSIMYNAICNNQKILQDANRKYESQEQSSLNNAFNSSNIKMMNIIDEINKEVEGGKITTMSNNMGNSYNFDLNNGFNEDTKMKNIINEIKKEDNNKDHYKKDNRFEKKYMINNNKNNNIFINTANNIMNNNVGRKQTKNLNCNKNSKKKGF